MKLSPFGRRPRVPTRKPITTVPEDRPTLRELPDGFIVFQYSQSPGRELGSQFWLVPLFWQGPASNAWVAGLNGKVPDGTAVFPSREQALDAFYHRPA